MSPLISLFLRDGTANFAVLFGSMVVNAVFTVTNHGPDEQLGIPWLIATNAVMGSRLYLNLRGHIVRTAVPSLSAFECQVDLPSGSTMTMISRDHLQLNWQHQRKSYTSTVSGSETMCNPFSHHGGQDDAHSMFALEHGAFGDEEDGDKLVYHRTDKVSIPSLKLEPAEFDGFVPEVISLSELESASRVALARGIHIRDEGCATVAQASSRSTLLSPTRDCPTRPERFSDSAQTHRPCFSSVSSDFFIHVSQ